MQTLKQYTDLILQFKIKKEELAVLVGGEETLMGRYFKGIAEGQYETDAEAAKDLYNQSVSYPAYKTLKSELKKRLIHAVSVLDFKQPLLNDVQQAYYTGQKNWSIINILLGRLKIQAAIDLAQTTLELAKRFELTELTVNIARFLTRMYHTHHPLSKQANEYEKLYKTMRQVLEAEYLAEELYDDIAKNFIKIKASQKHLQNKAIEYVEKLAPLSILYDSYRLHVSKRLIEVIRYMCVNDYESTLKVANEAILFFEQKPFELKSQIAIFLDQKTICCMQLKSYEEGRESAFRSRSLVIEGTYNWFKGGLTYIQLCFHTLHYQEAWETYMDMIQRKEYKNQNTVLKEEMLIAEAYLQYMIGLEKIKLRRGERKYVEAFDTYAFINNAPTFSKDKRGSNITILIAQILWLLRERNYLAVKARAEALDKYRTRHVDKYEDTFRTNLFIKLVNSLEKCRYRRKQVVNKTEKILIELKSAPVQVLSQAYAIEILPFNDIWGLMVDTLR
jgi:hypothetical protein